MEVWKSVKNYEGIYEVSNIGRVKSLKFGKEKILKQVIIKGYCCLDLCKNGNIKRVKIHRLVLLAFIQNHENKLEVNHIDGNKKNNNVSNLEWNTASENKKHALLTGLRIMPNGGIHHNSKLNENDVLKIREMGKNTIHKIISEKFNVSKSVVTNIINRKSWKHI